MRLLSASLFCFAHTFFLNDKSYTILQTALSISTFPAVADQGITVLLLLCVHAASQEYAIAIHMICFASVEMTVPLPQCW